MTKRSGASRTALALSTVILTTLSALSAQDRGGRGGPDRRGGPPRSQKTKLVSKFDADDSGSLNREERDQARAWLKDNPRRQRRRRGRRGPPGGQPENAKPRQPGQALSPEQVQTYTEHKFYDPAIVRTLFFTFPDADWEEELAAFHRSDVEVPATLQADGETYTEVGVRFRGNTSFTMVPAGQKRSFNISLDLVNKRQRIGGYKTLNLLNGHADPSFLREVLHAQIAGKFTHVPKANLVHLVINGESWGIYANVQQVNKDYLKEAFGTKKGARWRVPPDFSGGGGLKDLGDRPADYKQKYLAKSGVDQAAWRKLEAVCKTLADASLEVRRQELPSQLDIDGALWFLAIDNVLLDGDGYLARASDYMLYMDPRGQFHPVTHDNNEILGGSPRGGRGGRRRGMRPQRRGGDRPGAGAPNRPTRDGTSGRPDDRGPDTRGPGARGPGARGPGARGPGARGPGARGPGARGPGARGPGARGPGARGPGGPGGTHPEAEQGPLAGAENPNRPLLHFLLEVPEWRARYLAFVHSLNQSLAWDKLGPGVEQLHASIAEVTHRDTRKLYSNEAFDASIEAIKKITGLRHATLLESKELSGLWPELWGLKAEERAVDKGLELRVRVKSKGPIGKAWLYWQRTRPGSFERIAMQSDAEGLLWASIPAQKPGEKIHYYVELEAKGNSMRLAFAPAGASSRAEPHRFSK